MHSKPHLQELVSTLSQQAQTLRTQGMREKLEKVRAEIEGQIVPDSEFSGRKARGVAMGVGVFQMTGSGHS